MYKHEVLGPFPSTEKKFPNLTSFHSSWSLLLLRSQATRERQGRASLESACESIWGKIGDLVARRLDDLEPKLSWQQQGPLHCTFKISQLSGAISGRPGSKWTFFDQSCRPPAITSWIFDRCLLRWWNWKIIVSTFKDRRLKKVPQDTYATSTWKCISQLLRTVSTDIHINSVFNFPFIQ